MIPQAGPTMPDTFQHHMIVRQEHLNQYGYLFGGHVLAVVDELAFIACARTWPGLNFVTRAVQQAEFHSPATLGAVLEFRFGIAAVGRTSVQVRVTLHIHDPRQQATRQSFDGIVVMVCVDAAGRAMSLPPVPAAAPAGGR
jgi:acyl-CoA hydrolase